VVVLLLVLTGCTGNAAALTGSSWPGIATSDDMVYVAFGPHVYAVDASNGKEEWRYPAQAVRGETFYAVPAVDQDLVVVGDYTGTLYGLDFTKGTETWKFQAPLKARFIAGAVIGEKYVYAGTVAGHMYAVDRDTGTQEWEFAATRDIWSAPLLDDGVLYFTALDRHLYALNADTGKLLWQFPDADTKPEESPVGAMVGTPTLHDGALYFGSFSNAVYALDLETRKLLWTYPTKNWVWGSPIYDENTNQLFGGDLDGNVFAIDPATGKEGWKFTTGGPVVNSPVTAEYDGKPAVFVTSGDSNLYILNPENGEQIEKVGVTAEFKQSFLFVPTGTTIRPIPVYARPIVLDDKILLGTHEGPEPIHAYNLASLKKLWTFMPTP
jgi:outer membrane protein assembly factor BamB